MKRLDVSPWNLGLPITMLMACGPIVAVDDAGTETESDTLESETLTTVGTSVGTTVGSGECRVDADCEERGWGYACIDGECIYEYSCDDCCDGECGWYGECYIDEDCGQGQVCRYNYCEPAPGPEECVGYELASPIQLAPGDEPIIALAFVEALPSAGRELAIATASSVTVLASDGNSAAIDVPDVAELAAADLDLDGDEDLVLVVGGATPSVRSLLADGTGAFLDGATMEIVATQLALGDFDADGPVDLVTGSATGTDLHHGLGNGAFEGALAIDGDEPTIAIAAVPASVGTDLLFYSTNSVWWASAALGLSADNLEPEVALLTTGSLAVGDYDGDGLPDATAIDIATGAPLIQTWHDLATLPSAIAWTPPASYDHAASGDLDADGRDDLVLLAANGELAVRLGRDAAADTDPLGCYALGLTAEFASRLLVDDFDGDGRGDVIAASGATLAWTRLQ